MILLKLSWSQVNIQYMGVFLKWWYPTTMGFPTKNDHFGDVLGIPPFKETPIYIYIYLLPGSSKGCWIYRWQGLPIYHITLGWTTALFGIWLVLYHIWGVSKNRGTPKWMVYNGTPYLKGWLGGTTIFGNTHMFLKKDRDGSVTHASHWRSARILAPLRGVTCPMESPLFFTKLSGKCVVVSSDQLTRY